MPVINDMFKLNILKSSKAVLLTCTNIMPPPQKKPNKLHLQTYNTVQHETLGHVEEFFCLVLTRLLQDRKLVIKRIFTIVANRT